MNVEPAESIEVLRERVVSASMTSREPIRAGFWRRAGAYFLDLTVVDFLLILFVLVREAALDLASSGGFRSAMALPDVMRSSLPLWAALYVIYFTFFTYWGGRTPGKLLMRLKVITLNGEEISLGHSMLRTLGYFLSHLSFGFGFLLAAFPPHKRALQDYVAGTYVIRIQKSV